MTNCKHTQGDHIKGLQNAWVCGQCYKILASRPEKWGMVMCDVDGGEHGERQEITWRAAILKSNQRTTLNTFLAAMAKRLMKADCAISTYEAHKLALEELENIDEVFANDTFDWSRLSARDIIEECM